MSKRIRFMLIGFSVVFFVAVSSSSAMALGVGTSPERFNVEIAQGDSKYVVLNVGNIPHRESQAVEIDIYVGEEEYQDWFLFQPDVFLLQPDESKDVRITITPPVKKSGEHQAIIRVVSRDPESNDFGVGLMIPCNISIPCPENGFPLSMASLAGSGTVVLIVLVSLWITRRRKNRIDKHPTDGL